MRIFVKTHLSHPKVKCLTLEVQLSDTLENIQDMILDKIGFQNTIILYLYTILIAINQYNVFIQ